MTFDLPAYPASVEIEQIYRWLREHSQRFFPRIDYRQLLPPTPAEIDEVHEEVPEYQKRWAEAIQLRAYCLPSDESHPMTVFGIEELRDVVLFVTVPCLEDAGLATRSGSQVKLVAATGDRFHYSQDTWYDILEWRRGRNWANMDAPLEYQAIAERVRREAQDYILGTP